MEGEGGRRSRSGEVRRRTFSVVQKIVRGVPHPHPRTLTLIPAKPETIMFGSLRPVLPSGAPDNSGREKKICWKPPGGPWSQFCTPSSKKEWWEAAPLGQCPLDHITRARELAFKAGLEKSRSDEPPHSNSEVPSRGAGVAASPSDPGAAPAGAAPSSEKPRASPAGNPAASRKRGRESPRADTRPAKLQVKSPSTPFETPARPHQLARAIPTSPTPTSQISLPQSSRQMQRSSEPHSRTPTNKGWVRPSPLSA